MGGTGHKRGEGGAVRRTSACEGWAQGPESLPRKRGNVQYFYV